MGAANGNALRIWRAKGQSGLELRVGSSFEHPYPPHWHEDYFLSAITGGVGHFHFRSTHHRATPGTLVFVAPAEVHSHCDSEGGRSFRSMHVSVSMMAGIFREIDGRRGVLPDMPSVLIAGDHMHETFLQLHRAFDDGDSRLQRDSMLLGFFRRLAARVRKENVPKYRDACEISGVRSAREFLHAHFDCEVSLRDLAAIAGLSPYYFHRVFCRTLGLPPHAYQLQVRIMRAKSMIRDGRPLAHVAAATGFADQSHFTRHFKRLTGTTPARYAG